MGKTVFMGFDSICFQALTGVFGCNPPQIRGHHCTCFANWKKCEEAFHFYGKSWKAATVSRLGWVCGSPSVIPYSRTMFLILVSSPQGFELFLWALGVCLHLFWGAVSKICPKVSEKLKEVIFWVWECSKIYPYKLMVIVSFLDAILA